MNQTAPSLAEKIRVSIQDDILSGDLKPGERIDEQRLADRFDASRTPVREALRGLEARQMISRKPNCGLVVRVLTLKEIVDIFQVMAELEGLCARLAARRRTDTELAELQALHCVCAEKVEAGDEQGFYAANIDWHQAIYRISRNDFLQQETELLRLRVGPYRRFITKQPQRMTLSLKEHEIVAEAISSHSDDLAHSFMRDHVNILGSDVTDWMQLLDAHIEP